MAIQPPQRFELDDLTRVEREARTIYAPGATPGDVLVVQSDHSLVAAPGGGSQTLRALSVPVAFSDFTADPPASGFGTAPIYDLQPGEQLVGMVGRVTVAFNDSGVPTLQAVASADWPNTETILLAIGTNGALPTPFDGLVGLVSGGFNAGISPWGGPEPVEPDTTAVPIFALLSGTYNGDGTTGSATFTLYLATPTA